jgi:hypothetical protein
VPWRGTCPAWHGNQPSSPPSPPSPNVLRKRQGGR